MVSYATPARFVVAFAVGAALLLALAVGLDWPGRILASAGALLLGAEALHDSLVRPTLTADGAGLVVRRMSGARVFEWRDIDAVRAHESRRVFVLQSLEIDIGDHLIAVPGFRLGSDPAIVAERLMHLRSAGASEQ